MIKSTRGKQKTSSGTHLEQQCASSEENSKQYSAVLLATPAIVAQTTHTNGQLCQLPSERQPSFETQFGSSDLPVASAQEKSNFEGSSQDQNTTQVMQYTKRT